MLSIREPTQQRETSGARLTSRGQNIISSNLSRHLEFEISRFMCTQKLNTTLRVDEMASQTKISESSCLSRGRTLARLYTSNYLVCHPQLLYYLIASF